MLVDPAEALGAPWALRVGTAASGLAWASLLDLRSPAGTMRRDNVDYVQCSRGSHSVFACSFAVVIVMLEATKKGRYLLLPEKLMMWHIF